MTGDICARTVYGPRQGLTSLGLGPSASLYGRWINTCSPGFKLGSDRVSLISACLSARSKQSVVVPVTTEHNSRHCILHIAAMIYIQCDDTRWCHNSGPWKHNNLRLRSTLLRGEKRRIFTCMRRCSSRKEKIEDRDRNRDFAISIKRRDRDRISPIYDPANRGEDRCLRRRSRSRSPTLLSNY